MNKTRICKVKRRYGNSESIEQQKLFSWIDIRCPDLRQICFAIPNGGSRHILEAVNLKRQGVTAGVPDIFLAFPRKGHHGLFIEIKNGKNKPTEKQLNMHINLSKNGYAVAVCYSFEEAKETILDYCGLAVS